MNNKLIHLLERTLNSRGKKLTKQAKTLVSKLQEDITTGKRQICENYGQKEIRKFMDKKLNGYDNFPI